ncbi:restriction modification system DNA specificity subunit [Calothrix sp. NIES-2100]|uniref:restriction endonuclease subunit S n=1 Tax=Calothrix sp. NIES-2100 TaxID=1954172 RepID=UPI000B5DC383|nr:restriction modification system DNA specificity subunit [Calothrix sp. NIES-2100]
MTIFEKQLPVGWQWVKLEEVADKSHYALSSGPFGSNLTSADYQSAGVPILRGLNVSSGQLTLQDLKFVSHAKAQELIRSAVKPGDVVVVAVGSSGLACLVPESLPYAIMSQNFNKITPDLTKVDSKYLEICINSEIVQKQLQQEITDSVRTFLSLTKLKNVEIPLPPLAEQKRIVAVLEKCDRLRRTRRYALQLSDTFLQSVFLETFGDPFVNPMGWEITQLGNLLEFPSQNGLYVPKDNYENNKSIAGIEMVHMSDLFYGIVSTGNLKRVNICQKDIKKYSIDENDLLVARRSLVYEGAAKPCRVPQLKEPLVFESSIIRLRVNQSKLLPVYIYYYLSNERVRLAHVLKYVTESTISGINQSGLNSVEVINPPLSLQEKFAQIVQKFERFRTQQREAERQAEHLFQTLLHRAFRGELTSSDFDDEAVSALSQEIDVKQAKPKSTGDIAEYLHTKVSQQETEAVQLTLPGLE